MREVMTPFIISLVVFTGILFIFKSLKLVELVISKNVPLRDILYLFSLTIPGFMELAIPMATLISVIYAMGRLSSDSELVVMRSFGLQLRQLSAPVIFFSLMTCALGLFITLWLRPNAKPQIWRNHV